MYLYQGPIGPLFQFITFLEKKHPRLVKPFYYLYFSLFFFAFVAAGLSSSSKTLNILKGFNLFDWLWTLVFFIVFLFVYFSFLSELILN